MYVIVCQLVSSRQFQWPKYLKHFFNLPVQVMYLSQVILLYFVTPPLFGEHIYNEI